MTYIVHRVFKRTGPLNVMQCYSNRFRTGSKNQIVDENIKKNIVYIYMTLTYTINYAFYTIFSFDLNHFFFKMTTFFFFK